MFFLKKLQVDTRKINFLSFFFHSSNLNLSFFFLVHFLVRYVVRSLSSTDNIPLKINTVKYAFLNVTFFNPYFTNGRYFFFLFIIHYFFKNIGYYWTLLKIPFFVWTRFSEFVNYFPMHLALLSTGY